MTLVLVEPPDSEPLTADEARARVQSLSDVDDDNVVNALIAAARAHFDGDNSWLRRAILTQTWDLRIDSFYPDAAGPYRQLPYMHPNWYGRPLWQPSAHPGIAIPLPPLQKVVSVKYLDSDGAVQTIDPTVYTVHSGEPAHLLLAHGKSWPSTSNMPGAITIRFIAGYGDDGSDVDERIRTAIALQAGYLRAMMDKDFMVQSERIGPLSQSFTFAGHESLSNAAMALVQPLRSWT